MLLVIEAVGDILQVLFDFLMPWGLPNGIESGVVCNLDSGLSHAMGRRAVRKREAKLMGESEAVGVDAE